MANERVRRDVQSLIAEGPSGLKVLEDYATAIAAMQAIDADAGPGDPTDPRSWRYQAAIHGFPGLAPSLDDPQRWGTCRHFSWFFLAWHRVYLFYFERMIQFHLQDGSWSLPYWDYTKVDDDSSRILPEPFRSPRDGNPLFVAERDADVNDETKPTPLPFDRCDARGALAFGDLAVDPADALQSFGGGIVADVDPNAGLRGALEGTPHGQVHVLVGGDQSGYMFRFETAGLDPIFWLHHCNLDHLWDVWIAKWGADRLPSDDAFLDTEFHFFDFDGSAASMLVRDILTSSDLGYVYESTDQPDGTPGPDPLRELAAPEPVPMTPPELLGAATGVDFSGPTAVGIELAANTRVAAAVAGEEAVAPRWYLRVEDVAGSDPKAPSYDVYLNLPEGAAAADHPELRAGSVAAFGIAEATRPDAEHGGLGVTDTFEVTKVVEQLVARDDLEFDPAKVTVHVVPVGLKGPLDDGGDVRAGRISIYAG